MTGSEIQLFDSHCHLDRFPRNVKIADLVTSAENAGVKKFFVPGVTGFPARIFELSKFSQILTGWGVHPFYADSFEENCCEEIAQALRKSVCCGIGECGLDRRVPVNIEVQRKTFQWQIDLAIQSKLPLIVHLVGHYDTALKMLGEKSDQLVFVMHSYAGSYEIAARFFGFCSSKKGCSA
jgi:TatD DNase family protein